MDKGILYKIAQIELWKKLIEKVIQKKYIQFKVTLYFIIEDSIYKSNLLFWQWLKLLTWKR